MLSGVYEIEISEDLFVSQIKFMKVFDLYVFVNCVGALIQRAKLNDFFDILANKASITCSSACGEYG